MLQSTLKNRTVFCRDNLDILQNIDSNTIDLIYLDPPFNKNKVFTAPIGSSAEGASFKDIFRQEDIKDEWLQTIKEDNIELYNFLNGVKNISSNKHHLYNYCYLAYMAIRLMEMQRILKDTGSIYFHCDPTMSHYIKLLMDIIFGEKNFRNEIIWCYKGASEAKKSFPKKHDIIFYYSKSEQANFNFDSIRIPYKSNNIKPAKWKDGIHKKNPLGTKCLDW
ncbi:MAG: DNA methyltransferase, partial [Halobacteriovoraceae bacterium]|nr:DNA methyltransferase [Halobacteriovoraceae bacterium]